MDGKCGESYGLNVAKMANIPQSIIDHANEIAQEFSRNHTFNTTNNKIALTDLAAFADIIQDNVPIKVKQRAIQSIE